MICVPLRSLFPDAIARPCGGQERASLVPRTLYALFASPRSHTRVIRARQLIRVRRSRAISRADRYFTRP